MRGSKMLWEAVGWDKRTQNQ